MSDLNENMGIECGKLFGDMVLKWTNLGADPLDVIECFGLSIGAVMIESQAVENGNLRTITAAEAGDVVAEFVEDGFKSTRMLLLEEYTGNVPK